jgi:hypothetical protein
LNDPRQIFEYNVCVSILPNASIKRGLRDFAADVREGEISVARRQSCDFESIHMKPSETAINEQWLRKPRNLLRMAVVVSTFLYPGL